MVEPTFADQKRQLDKAYLRFTDYQDVASLSRLKLIIEQVMTYAQKKQVEMLKILDIGCGRGDVSFPLLSLGHLVTGIDIAPESVLACRNKNQFAGAHFLVADAQSFDLGGRFDMVICSEVLEHVLHPDLVVANFGKHLKEGGAVIVTIPNGYCLHEILVNRLGVTTIAALIRRSKLLAKLVNCVGIATDTDYFMNPYQRHLQFFTLRRLQRLLSLYGFRTVSIHDQVLEIPMRSLQGPLRPLQIILRLLTHIKLKIAKFLPHCLAEGWLLVINRGTNSS
jgi:2-polyprenyl-3-methyl-5-hydroxy-6-metoxy-1,4-benzoquinol methylase